MFPMQISLIFKLVTQIGRTLQQKIAWFDSEFNVSYILYSEFSSIIFTFCINWIYSM